MSGESHAEEPRVVDLIIKDSPVRLHVSKEIYESRTEVAIVSRRFDTNPALANAFAEQLKEQGFDIETRYIRHNNHDILEDSIHYAVIFVHHPERECNAAPSDVSTQENPSTIQSAVNILSSINPDCIEKKLLEQHKRTPLQDIIDERIDVVQAMQRNPADRIAMIPSPLSPRSK